ncbi:TetR/AcrR family transcriptional regulator [Oceanobacillus timonensis]|uniref:TetR/AcrR family transcriptional regulator n=1 Tax=Oceanobacillus timonensis TaxID=1926285 RepID=UPI0009BA108A|nr:TetR/AcrR family transcriptional regulator [Oceanobacillus timonensis]
MKKSQKKEAIIQTAEKLFYEHGFHAVGVKSILNQAGVAPMTMYYHFQSKEELIKEILTQREKRYFRLLEDEFDKGSGIHSYIQSLINAHINWLKTAGFNGCLFLRAKQEYEGVNEEIVSLSKAHKRKLLEKMEKDLNSKSLSVQISVMLEGLTSMDQILDLDELKDTAMELSKRMQVSV